MTLIVARRFLIPHDRWHLGACDPGYLPTSRGFRNHTGYLIGMQSYTSNERWQHGKPSNRLEEAGVLVHLFDDFEIPSELLSPAPL